MTAKEQLARILYSQLPLTTRWEALRTEIQEFPWGHKSALNAELDSMARSAAENRETPFLFVGKDLLTYCDQQLYREIENRDEDPRGMFRHREDEEEPLEP